MKGIGVKVIALAFTALVWATTLMAADSGKTESKPFPYYGTFSAAQPQTKTFTLTGKSKPRVIHVTAQTKITREGKAVTLAEGKAGERVTGTMIKDAAGQQQALTVRFAVQPEGATPKGKTAASPKPR